MGAEQIMAPSFQSPPIFQETVGRRGSVMTLARPTAKPRVVLPYTTTTSSF